MTGKRVVKHYKSIWSPSLWADQLFPKVVALIPLPLRVKKMLPIVRNYTDGTVNEEEDTDGSTCEEG